MEEGNSIWVSHVDGQAPKQIPAASYRVYISRNLELKMELRHKKFKFRHSQTVQGMPSWHIKCLTDHLKKTIFKLKTYCHFIIFAWLTVKQALGGDHEFNYSAKKKKPYKFPFSLTSYWHCWGNSTDVLCLLQTLSPILLTFLILMHPSLKPGFSLWAF